MTLNCVGQDEESPFPLYGRKEDAYDQETVEGIISELNGAYSCIYV